MPRTAHDVVFVDGVRTPFGKAGPKGVYAETRADDLVIGCVRELLRRNPNLPPERVDEVAIAATTQIGDQGLTLGRLTALLSGLPKSVPGYSIDRMCAGAMTAVTTTAGGIAFGAYDVVIAGGVEHLLPHLVRTGQVRTFPIGRYWRDVGRPEAYLAAHRDLIAGRVDALTDRRNPVLSTSVERSPGVVHAGAQVEDSVVGLGADVRGRVVRSVLGPGAVVQAGALVQDSVLFDDVVVEAGAQVRTCIVDEGVVVGREAVVGADAPSRNPRDKDITLVGRDSRIARRSTVPAGARLEPGTRT